MAQLKATIPFPCASLQEAITLQDKIVSDEIVVDTRGDELQLVQAMDGDFQGNEWYVVIHTGNLLGMIADLRDEGFL